MNQIFYFPRFLACMKQELLLGRQHYLINLYAAFAGSFLMLFGMMLSFDYPLKFESAAASSISIYLFFYILVLSSFTLNSGAKNVQIVDMMIPASDFEKFLTRFLLRTVLCTVVLVLVTGFSYVLVCWSSVLFKTTAFSCSRALELTHSMGVVVWTTFGGFALLQSLCVLSGALFRKYAIIKIAMTIMLVVYLLSFVIDHVSISMSLNYVMVVCLFATIAVYIVSYRLFLKRNLK